MRGEKKRFLEAGKIVNTHGISGEVKVMPWCDGAEMLCEFKTLYTDQAGKNPVEIVSARVHKNMAVLRIAGVDDVDSANALRGTVLYFDREAVELPKGCYFITDLLGLSVVDADSGEEYGILCDVTQTGANDVYHVDAGEGKTLLVPAIPDVIDRVDLDGGILLIRPLKGMFDDAD